MSGICQRTAPDRTGFEGTQPHDCRSKTAPDLDKLGPGRTWTDRSNICCDPMSDTTCSASWAPFGVAEQRNRLPVSVTLTAQLDAGLDVLDGDLG